MKKTITYTSIRTKSYSTNSLVVDISNNVWRYGYLPLGYNVGQNQEGEKVLKVNYVKPTRWQVIKYLFTGRFI